MDKIVSSQLRSSDKRTRERAGLHGITDGQQSVGHLIVDTKINTSTKFTELTTVHPDYDQQIILVPQSDRFVTLNPTNFGDSALTSNIHQANLKGRSMITSSKIEYPTTKRVNPEQQSSNNTTRIVSTEKSIESSSSTDTFQFELFNNPTVVINNSPLTMCPTITLKSNDKNQSPSVGTVLDNYFVDISISDENCQLRILGNSRVYFDTSKSVVFYNMKVLGSSSKYFNLRFDVKNSKGLQKTIISPPILFTTRRLIVEKVVPNVVSSNQSTEVAVMGFFSTSRTSALDSFHAKIEQNDGPPIIVKCYQVGQSLIFETPILQIERQTPLQVIIKNDDEESEPFTLVFNPSAVCNVCMKRFCNIRSI
eukprot:TRINITY_DN281_c2_g1_i4.p1 TRINITY_DN281_c2_g1~~TRINITY_DN281_c2_g1_i4.p1  ORF type:complete len:366 (-),score=30.51 TRINITY_DN281_c2_g1_i4:35-1132(-)